MRHAKAPAGVDSRRRTNDPRIRRLSWPQYARLIDRIVQELDRRQFQPDLIVGIVRGGLIPSVSLSHATGCRTVGVLDIRRTTSDRPLTLPVSRLRHDGTYIPPGTFARILIVDDIVGRGLTLVRAHELIGARHAGALVQTVTLFDDLNYRKAATFYTTCGHFAPATLRQRKWVTFAWERPDAALRRAGVSRAGVPRGVVTSASARR